MTRRKHNEEHIRTLTKTAGGASYMITIPIRYISQLGWKARQKLEVHLDGEQIVIKDWKK
ncbi:MAG TPA: AbrB/MazE/SpoVT family DNA-binding domain-containing protein [Bacteroidales bacterium]|nr:AbrB/MazE/SpoVT family DNA-binding domain-containing protein [Bacteroidales bacterium]